LGVPEDRVKQAWKRGKKDNGQMNGYEAEKLGERFGHKIDKYTQGSLANFINSSNRTVQNNAMMGANTAITQQNMLGSNLNNGVVMSSGLPISLNTGNSLISNTAMPTVQGLNIGIQI
jgi:hypothetical protein